MSNLSNYGKQMIKEAEEAEDTLDSASTWDGNTTTEEEDVRSYNVGKSDYSKHSIQPWDIWIKCRLNPFEADIVKRLLRTKSESGMTAEEARKLDYEKIIHISQEIKRQQEEKIIWEGKVEADKSYIYSIIKEYNMLAFDAFILEEILKKDINTDNVIELCKERISSL